MIPGDFSSSCLSGESLEGSSVFLALSRQGMTCASSSIFSWALVFRGGHALLCLGVIPAVLGALVVPGVEQGLLCSSQSYSLDTKDFSSCSWARDLSNQEHPLDLAFAELNFIMTQRLLR